MVTSLDRALDTVLDGNSPLQARHKALDVIESVAQKVFDPFFQSKFKKRMLSELGYKFNDFRKGVTLSVSLHTDLERSIVEELNGVIRLTKRGLTQGKWDGALYLSLFPEMEKVVGPWKG